MVLKLMGQVKAVAKSYKNMRDRIKYYHDLQRKKDLACRIMVKWRFRNLKYGH